MENKIRNRIEELHMEKRIFKGRENIQKQIDEEIREENQALKGEKESDRKVAAGELVDVDLYENVHNSIDDTINGRVRRMRVPTNEITMKDGVYWYNGCVIEIVHRKNPMAGVRLFGEEVKDNDNIL